MSCVTRSASLSLLCAHGSLEAVARSDTAACRNKRSALDSVTACRWVSCDSKTVMRIHCKTMTLNSTDLEQPKCNDDDVGDLTATAAGVVVVAGDMVATTATTGGGRRTKKGENGSVTPKKRIRWKCLCECVSTLHSRL